MITLPRRLAHLLLALAVALGPALLSAPSASAAAPADASASTVPDPLRVGTEGVYAPFSIKQGDDFTGFDVEVMKAVGESSTGRWSSSPTRSASPGQVADEVLFIDGGAVVERGAPEQMILDPQAERTRSFLQRILDPL